MHRIFHYFSLHIWCTHLSAHTHRDTCINTQARIDIDTDIDIDIDIYGMCYVVSSICYD